MNPITENLHLTSILKTLAPHGVPVRTTANGFLTPDMSAGVES